MSLSLKMPFYGFLETALLPTWTKQMSLSDHIIHLLWYKMVCKKVQGQVNTRGTNSHA